MQIIEALGLQPRQTIALVGAGGKTTLMFRLAGELAAAGYRVVTSTTTRLAVREIALAPECIACEEADRLLAALPNALARHRHVLAVECVIPEKDRVGGLTSQVLERIATLPDVDFLLVEADGSRERPFKAPATHEPSIPDCATVVIPVVGLDILGCPLTEDYVHRSALVADLAQVEPGEPITPAVIASVLGHLQGGVKNVPPRAQVIPFLNKAENRQRCTDSWEIAHTLLDRPWVERVLIGAVATSDPVRAVLRRPV
jgi:probable selenium-dependent hydroxylase accessory protein YqeC